jgi:hypothetical protein
MAARNFLATFSMSSTSRMSTNCRPPPPSSLGADGAITAAASRLASMAAADTVGLSIFSDLRILRLSSSFLNGFKM